MVDPKKNQGRKRPVKNTYTTKSGTSIKLNRSLSERIKARRDAKSRRRAVYLSTLPKNRFKRILYRLHPKRVYRYWFSRQGGIMALKLIGIGIVVFFVVIVGVFAYFRKDLPDINDLSGSKLGGSISYYDRTAQTLLWQDYNDVKRVPVPANQIPDVMRQTTVAIEDKKFYHEGAFNVQDMARAALHDVSGGGGGLQGGSTITQQLVKLNENWTGDETISRKIKELILATELEREYSKADILNAYLNIAPYGPVEYGVETAAEDYFHVEPNQLSLAQSAMLAAIPKSPSVYSPYGPEFDSSALLSRQQYVLDQMAAQGMITKAQAEAAKQVNVLAQVQPEPGSLYSNIQAPYFVQGAKEQLDTMYGTSAVDRGGWKVVTTVDMGLQQLAEQQVANDMPQIRKQGGDNAAFVAEQVNTGEIVALVGGYDFNNAQYGQINYATDVNLSPGSSFKPYDYSTFIENNNAGAGSVIYDSQNALPGYPCTDKTRPLVTTASDPDGSQKCLWDYDFNYPGPITLRYALGGSRNVPAVKVMLSAIPNDSSPGHTASINKVIATADAMMGNPQGYECYSSSTNVGPGADPSSLKAGETQCYGSSAIGDGAYIHLDDHVNGIATLARLGKEIPRTFILKITDTNNKTIYNYIVPKGTQVIHQDTAYIVDNMASDPNASYLPGRCTTGTDATCTPLSSFGYKFQRYNGWNNAVKTGTTNSAFDGLMESWNTQYAAVVWVGDHTRTVAMHSAMEYMTEPVVRGWMQGALNDLNEKPINWTQPSDIKTEPAYVVSHDVSSPHLGEVIPSASTDIFPSWFAPKSSSNGSQTIDIVSGLVATSCTPQLAQKTQGNANVNQFSVDIFYGTTSSATSSSNATTDDNVHNCNDTKPTISVTQGSCEEAGKCDFTVAVTQGTHSLSGGSYTSSPAGTISLIVNGQTAQTINIPTDSSSQASYNYTFSGVSVTDGQSVEAQVVDSVLYSGSESIQAQNTGTSTGGGTTNGNGQ